MSGETQEYNLLAGVKPTVTQYGSMADGVITSSTPKDNWTDVAVWPITTETLAENQTMHIGISAKWHGAAATTGAAWASVKYADTAGNTNVVDIQIDGITTEWKRFSLSAVVPSGMHLVDFHLSGDKLDAAYDATSFVLSYGSPVPLASSAHTPYATQDHVAAEYATKAALKVTSDAVTAEVTERGKLAGRVGTLESTSGTHASKLEQLATSIKSLVKGESTYTDPDGKSATSGIYSLVTQTRDSVTALFGQYTKTADLASTQAVKDAKKAGTDAQAAASAAQSTADSLATMIREDATGITVGKSADGQTWSTGRTHMDEDSFDILDKAGSVLSSFGKSLIELGKNSKDATISMLAGLAKIVATRLGGVAGIDISSGSVTVRGTGGGFAVSGAFPGTANGTGAAMVEAVLSSEIPTVIVSASETNAETGVTRENRLEMAPDGFEMSDPAAMLSALGLGAAATYQAATTDSTLTYDSTTVLRWGRVCVMPISVHYTSDWAPSEYAFFTLPEAVRPSVEQRGTVTSCPYNWTSDYRPALVAIGTDGKVRLSGHAAGHWLGQLVWVV